MYEKNNRSTEEIRKIFGIKSQPTLYKILDFSGVNIKKFFKNRKGESSQVRTLMIFYKWRFVYVSVIAPYFDESGGCLMANIGLESAQVNPEFIMIIRKFLEDWIAAFSYIFQSQHQQPEARMMAEQAVQEIEGAVMLSVIFDDKRYFLTACERIRSYLT